MPKTPIVIHPDTLLVPGYPVVKFEGIYSGSYANGFISINLNYVQGKIASGFAIQRGTRRNLNGTLKPNGKSFSFLMNEPGNMKSDGLFQFSIDTAKFALSGVWKAFDTSNIASVPILLKKQAVKTELINQNELGTWIPLKGSFRKDTTLDFSTVGICEYKFYEYAGDSTSRIISVKGSYVIKKDSVYIDWQKNAWTPALKMKLIRTALKIAGKEDPELRLSGNGWKLVKPD